MKAKRDGDRFVLDSYAILTHLKEEAGWREVESLLWDAHKNKISLFLNLINLGEVYYITYREKGPVLADRAIATIKLWSLSFVDVQEEIAIIAGRIKAENKLSYADAYAVATALEKKASIVTGDREFKSIEDLANILWLPRNR